MLPHMSASQHQSKIRECQILRVGPFFMVEDPPKTIRDEPDPGISGKIKDVMGYK